MANETNALLTEFINQLMLDANKAQLDPRLLPPEYQDLGLCLLKLQKNICEESAFANALSNGDLDVEVPGRGNYMAAPLKSLHNSLMHLSWQTKQVASGDYSQRLDFMGEFSDAFNQMVHQLDERKQKLLHEADVILAQNASLQRSKDLMVSITNAMTAWIVVLDNENNKELFINESLKKRIEEDASVMDQLRDEICEHKILPSGQSIVWNTSIRNGSLHRGIQTNYYEIESHSIYWDQKMATVHMITDVTNLREEAEKMKEIAFVDDLTQTYSRHYGMQKLVSFVDEGKRFTVAFIDLDNLKYINDQFGHNAGDLYLISVARKLSSLDSSAILSRVGGDEFMLLVENIHKKELEKKLEKLRAVLPSMKFNEITFKPSFSYGCREVTIDNTHTSSEILREADVEMYRYKYANKPKI